MNRRYRTYKTPGGYWSHRELMSLATGLQKYGFADPQKISSIIETKSPLQVKIFINRKLQELRKAKKTTGTKVKKSRNVKDAVKNAEGFKDWSTLRMWQKITENQLSFSDLRQDYSRIILKKLCENFYNEAKQATNPEILDVKAIYKFMLECVSGEVPGQLAIKESAYIISLLREMREKFKKCDFQEESEFILNFRMPVEYVPSKVKGDFKEKLARNPGIVLTPLDLHETLLCHRQLVNSFNPLRVPVWMIIKEHKYLQKEFFTARSNDKLSTSDEQNIE